MAIAAFIEESFPVDISYGSSGGPKFFTSLTQTDSGAERRVVHWSEPLREYEASTGIQSLPGEAQQAGLSRLISFFNVARGRAVGFRYKDWSDYSTAKDLTDTPTAIDHVLVAKDATRTTFQLRRAYLASVASNSAAVWRTIRKPVSGTVRVALGGIQATSGWTVNLTTGIVTFAAAVGVDVIVSAGCEYDVPCRFGDDHLSVRLDDYLSGSAQVPVREVRT